MARVFPFPALRPAPASAALVAAVPYDVVSVDEARALAAGNPLSFLHVSRPEIDLPPGSDPHAAAAYEMARANFQRLTTSAPLVREDVPSVYVYRLRMGAHEQTGVAACFSIEEYDRGEIKKHEKTRPDKEDDRTRHMQALSAQTGPVLLTYRASAAIRAVLERVVQTPALFDFVAADGIAHQIWRMPAAEHAALTAAFADVPALYIADGHHRAASASRTRRALASRGAGEHDRVLAVAFAHDQMQVLPYHRVVRDLHGLTPEAFVNTLRGRELQVTAGGPASPATRGQVGMYFDHRWHTLDLRKHDLRGGEPSGSPALDVTLLEQEVLDPVLGIKDLRTDKRIDFVGGIRGTGELERQVDSGAFSVAFSMYPVSLTDLMRISDEGGIMPPKSTWFEPKLRDGLLSHLI